MSADENGRYYWCVKTPLSPDGEIYVYADRVSVRDGSLILLSEDRHEINMAFAPGNWRACFVASVIDGHAVAVEHWTGEVVR